MRARSRRPAATQRNTWTGLKATKARIEEAYADRQARKEAAK